MKKTYVGSCHYGTVRFEADIDFSQGTFKCNCSFCKKARNWLAAFISEAFRPLAGDSDLTDYQRTPASNQNLFCKRCGIRAFGWGEAPELGGKFYAVNVTCLDDVNVNELLAAPMTIPE